LHFYSPDRLVSLLFSILDNCLKADFEFSIGFLEQLAEKATNIFFCGKFEGLQGFFIDDKFISLLLNLSISTIPVC